MASPARAHSADEELADFVGGFYSDPLGFVQACYPWGEKGTSLEKYDGPDKWQAKFLDDLGAFIRVRNFNGADPVMPVRMAVASGHGPGKSTMAAWLVDFIMSTRPHCRGTVTANKWEQLETKTWSAVQKWTALCLTSHWFTVNASKMYQKDHKDTWFCAAANSKEENSESFAGQHAADSTSFYVFDEDSGIPEVIHEVAEGGLTDGEPMIFLFGNPTRNTGHFYTACFGAGRDKWNPVSLDARESKFTNKALIQEWVDERGEDSDFVRVRVRGLPPRASDLQFIDQERVWNAQKRQLPAVFPDEPLIAGVDVSDGGAAWNVVRFRRGSDARSIPPIRIPGEAVRGDRSAFLARLAEVLTNKHGGVKVAVMFMDSAFGAPYVERLRNMGHDNVQEVRFGSDAPNRYQGNMRAYMWTRMKEWLENGAIDLKDQRLESDLTAPGYHLNEKTDKLYLESKADLVKRGIASPDDADALALTFAAVVKPKRAQEAYVPTKEWAWS